MYIHMITGTFSRQVLQVR